MSPEVIAIIGVGGATLGVGVSLAALIVSGQRAIRADLHSLGERVARLEGAFPFIAARISDQRPGNPPA